MSDLLINILPQVAENINGVWLKSECSFTFGDVCPSVQYSDTKAKEFTNRFAQKPKTLDMNMQSFQPCMTFRQSNRSADFIAGVTSEESWRRFIDRGQMLHTLFASILTKADIDTAIDRLLFEGIIENNEQEKEIS